jgi:hypothetical protein
MSAEFRHLWDYLFGVMQSVVDTLPGDWADSSLVAEGDEVVDDEDVVLVLLRADVILESNLMSVIGFTLAD